MAIEFLKDIGLIRRTMQCGYCGQDMTWSERHDINDGVKGELLGPGAIGLRPSGTFRGFRTVGSLSKKSYFLRTTSCAANKPLKYKRNIASVSIQSQTGACFVEK
jgi:hypothetical protein